MFSTSFKFKKKKNEKKKGEKMHLIYSCVNNLLTLKEVKELIKEFSLAQGALHQKALLNKIRRDLIQPKE